MAPKGGPGGAVRRSGQPVAQRPCWGAVLVAIPPRSCIAVAFLPADTSAPAGRSAGPLWEFLKNIQDGRLIKRKADGTLGAICHMNMIDFQNPKAAWYNVRRPPQPEIARPSLPVAKRSGFPAAQVWLQDEDGTFQCALDENTDYIPYDRFHAEFEVLDEFAVSAAFASPAIRDAQNVSRSSRLRKSLCGRRAQPGACQGVPVC